MERKFLRILTVITVIMFACITVVQAAGNVVNTTNTAYSNSTNVIHITTNTTNNTNSANTVVASTNTSATYFDDRPNEFSEANPVVSSNGVTLTANNKYVDFNGSTLILTVEEDPNYSSLNGIQAELCMEGAQPDSIESMTESWEVTSYNVIDNRIIFLAEPTERALSNGWASIVNLKIKYHATNDGNGIYAWLNKGEFKTSHWNEETLKPLAYLSDVPFDFCVEIPEVVGNPVEPNPDLLVAEGSQVTKDYVKVDEHDIYVKMNPSFETGMNSLIDLLDLLKFDDSWTAIETSAVLAVDSVYDANYYFTRGEIESGSYYINTRVLPNVLTLILYCDYGPCLYTVHQMGNTYYDDVYRGGLININDVISLRRAIVGIEDVLNDFCFDVKASDVTFSNDELGTLGDIGDIMAMRERILTGSWKGVPNPVLPLTTMNGSYYSDDYQEEVFIFSEDGTVYKPTLAVAGEGGDGSYYRYNGTYSIDRGNIEVTFTERITSNIYNDEQLAEEYNEVVVLQYVNRYQLKMYKDGEYIILTK